MCVSMTNVHLNFVSTAKTDIEFSIHQGKMSLHAHDYIKSVRQNAGPLTDAEYEKHIKFFGGKNDNKRI